MTIVSSTNMYQYTIRADSPEEFAKLHHKALGVPSSPESPALNWLAAFTNLAGTEDEIRLLGETAALEDGTKVILYGHEVFDAATLQRMSELTDSETFHINASEEAAHELEKRIEWGRYADAIWKAYSSGKSFDECRLDRKYPITLEGCWSMFGKGLWDPDWHERWENLKMAVDAGFLPPQTQEDLEYDQQYRNGIKNEP